MKDLGRSVEHYRNGGAIFGFWTSVLVDVFFVGFYIAIAFFNIVEVNEMGKTMLLVVIPIFICLTVYMYFKSKTEIDIREHGLYVRNINKKHEILYDDIAKFDKTKRVGKSGPTIIVFYLLVIVKKDGERITFPCRINEEFINKLFEVSHLGNG